jgi:GT2 family glycosyltransferase
MTALQPVTVIVPVYGPGPHLRAVVEALQQQEPPVHHIIVSHSGSGDLSSLLKDKPNVTVLHSDDRLFAGAARNRGLQLATTEWAAFIDEDILVDQGWHAAVQSCIARGDVDAINGSVGFAASGGYWGMSRWFFEFSSAHPYLPPRRAETGGGGNLIVRRDIFRSLGAFPENWRMAEDVMALARLAQSGGRIQFYPKALGRHVNIGGMRSTLGHSYEFGLWTAKVRRAHPQLSGGAAVRWPYLSVCLWGVRLAQLYVRVLSTRNGPFLSLLFHTPGIVAALAAWNLGFSREAFR